MNKRQPKFLPQLTKRDGSDLDSSLGKPAGVAADIGRQTAHRCDH